MSKPTLYECWVKAGGNTADFDRDRYRELLIEHGHLVPAAPGQDKNLPCGWPGNTS